jgi:hypothetical protein
MIEFSISHLAYHEIFSGSFRQKNPAKKADFFCSILDELGIALLQEVTKLFLGSSMNINNKPNLHEDP